MLIFLIGLSGSGKSYWARQLADAWNWQRLDMDEIIAEQHATTIAQIFIDNGEAYFRKEEHQLLKNIIEGHSGKHTIIATGGGTPCFHGNIDLMNAHGITIYLEANATFLADRLAKATDRPLLTSASAKELEEKIKAMLASRKKIYEQAAIKIDTETAVTTTFAQAITDHTGEALKIN